ncbi:MAG: MFS transporter [Geminicoccaceae bacterium]|nr:MFS transporter [Geminicoccaceae bacterium]
MSHLASFAALLVSAGVLLAGNGLFGTLISVRANLEHFSPTTIGLIGSAFYAGFIAGSIWAPRLIIRAGHVRTFAAMGALYAASALIHAMLVSPLAWSLLRIAGGVCFAGLTLVLESWLNARSTNENRGRVLSVYRLVDLGCVTAGQFILTLADPRSYEIFSIVALFFCCALVPLSMSRAIPPSPPPQPKMRIMWLLRLSPLGAAGVFGVGLVNGTFRMVAPTVAFDLGLSVAEIAMLMSAFILGGAVLQFPMGALSDRIDRRVVLMIATVGAMISSGIMGHLATLGAAWFITAGFLFGGFAVPIYSIAMTHANDFAHDDEYVEVSAGLFLIFGIGATVGPFAGSAAVTLFGNSALFYYCSAMHGLLLLFAIYRRTSRPSIPVGQRGNFVGLIRTSPALFRLAFRVRTGSTGRNDAKDRNDSNTPDPKT